MDLTFFKIEVLTPCPGGLEWKNVWSCWDLAEAIQRMNRPLWIWRRRRVRFGQKVIMEKAP